MEYQPMCDLYKEWAMGVRHKLLDYNLTMAQLSTMIRKSPVWVSKTLSGERYSQQTIQAIDEIIAQLEKTKNAS